MEKVNQLKESLLLGVLNVGLPTVDVYSDLALTAKLYKSTVTIPPGRRFNGTSLKSAIINQCIGIENSF